MNTTAGTGTLLRFILRRDRFRLPWWLFGVLFLIGYQSVGSQSIYGTPEKLEQLRQTMGANAAAIAMSGPTELLQTIGGEIVFEIFAFVSIVVALMNMFLIGRHTRTDEESGRAELIRSTQVGRHAPLAAALSAAVLANLAAGLVAFAAAAGTGLPVGGAALLGAAVTGVGLSFAAVTAVLVQVFENHRAVNGAVGAILGLSFVLRAAGDTGDGFASWFSPIGWGQRTFPFAGDRWWPLLLPVAFTALLVPVAFALLNRRDFGAGLVQPRLGSATASRAFGSPLGLAWRLQRGTFIGWGIGLFMLGAAYGSFAESMQQYIEDNPEIGAIFPGGTESIVNGYVAFTLIFVAILAASYGIVTVLRARTEESAGRAESILATPTSRRGWLASHVVIALVGAALIMLAAGVGEGLTYGQSISDYSQVPRLAAVSLVYVPAIWVVVALAAFGFGWLPRAAAAISWSAIGVCVFMIVFVDLFDLPSWLRNISPFAHTPQAPLQAVTPTPLVAIVAVAAAVLVAGFVGFRRRDIG